jgi:DNA uptake protein ComE-like DNA-binding protein
MNRIKSIVFACALAALIAVPDAGHSQVGHSQLVNPDLASDKELLALPHITAALAKSIMEQRPFLT